MLIPLSFNVLLSSLTSLLVISPMYGSLIVISSLLLFVISSVLATIFFATKFLTNMHSQSYIVT